MIETDRLVKLSTYFQPRSTTWIDSNRILTTNIFLGYVVQMIRRDRKIKIVMDENMAVNKLKRDRCASLVNSVRRSNSVKRF